MGLECPVLAVAPPTCLSIGPEDDLHIKAGDSYTLEAWFAPCAVDTSTGTNIPAFIAGKLAAGGGYSLCISGNQVLATRGADALLSTSTIVVDDNAVWYHVAVVVNASTGNQAIMSLYLDGQLSGQMLCKELDPTTDIDSQSAPFTACGWLNSSNEQSVVQDSFCGYLGSVRLWRVARSQNDIVTWMYANPDSKLSLPGRVIYI